MRVLQGLFALLLVVPLAVAAAAQAPQPGRGAGAGPAPAGRQGGNPTATFPAQQRPLADAATIERGAGLYGVHCRACHGADLRGGDMGGPNLLRSPIALNDLDGELLAPVITQGRQTPGVPGGMPPIALPPEDIRAIAAHVHSVHASMRGQGSPPPGPPVELQVLVGDPVAGQAYFQSNCSACHSPSGDLQGIGTRLSDPMQLQNTWVAGGAARGPAGGASDRRTVTAIVTPPQGAPVEGRLERLDDFIVVLTTTEGTRSFSRTSPDVPRVTVNDPLTRHRQLLPIYTDRDIHNVTAYLATLK